MYNYMLNIKSRKQFVLILAAVVVQTGMLMGLMSANPNFVYNGYSHHRQYVELTDAFLDGRLYIKEANEDLMKLDNPYDTSERSQKNVYCEWDTAYYNGKYYVYFGVLPVIIYSLPMKVLFNRDVMPFEYLMVLVPFLVIFSYILVYEIYRRFFRDKEVPLLFYFMCSTLFVFGTGIYYTLPNPDIYDVPSLSGIVFALGGMAFWLKSFRYNENGYELDSRLLFLGSLFMSFLSACRPQMLVGMILGVILFWNTVFKDRKLLSKTSVKQSLCAVAPVAAVAVLMFIYNYKRFGSVFDFGPNYNLTTNDMTARGFVLGRLLSGIFHYLLQPMNIKGTFPYIASTNFSTNYMGLTINEAMYGGILFLQPLLWFTAFVYMIRGYLKEIKAFSLCIACVALSVIVACVNTEMAGILPRYPSDFLWLLYICFAVVFMSLYNVYKEHRYLLRTVFAAGFTLSIAISVLFVFADGGIAGANGEFYYGIESLINFWH